VILKFDYAEADFVSNKMRLNPCKSAKSVTSVFFQKYARNYNFNPIVE